MFEKVTISWRDVGGPTMVDAQPIETLPLREHVYERLQEMLIARTLAPGDHLVEERLAGQLGVSRGPVREALQRLHRDGWITLRPRHGAFVNRPSTGQVRTQISSSAGSVGAADTRLPSAARWSGCGSSTGAMGSPTSASS